MSDEQEIECEVQQAINRTHFDLILGPTLSAEQKQYLVKVINAAQKTCAKP